MGESKVSPDSVPWVLVIILAVLAAAFGTFWDALIPSSLACAAGMGTVEWVMEITVMPFIGVIILAALSRIKAFKTRISLTKITYLYTVLIVTSYFIQPAGHPFYTFARTISDRVRYPDQSLIVYPWFMAPPTGIAQQLVSGKIPVPWLDWLPSILFWWIDVVLFSFFLLCVANIFRRQWIDIERVPFPITFAAYQIAGNITMKESGEKKGRYRTFMVGVIIGLALQLPVGLAGLFPWFPDIFGWRSNTCSSGLGWIPSDSPLGAIAGLVGWRKSPASYFIGYLVPLSTLFNTWFWYLVYLILGQVFFMMGYYTGIMDKSGCGRAWCRPTPSAAPPIETETAATTGGGIMLTIMMLYLSRSYIRDTLRAALGKLPADTVQGLEKNEALSYRLNYLLVGVSFILVIGFLLATGVSPLTSVLIPLSAFVFWFSTLRIYGTTGIQSGNDMRGWAIPRLIYGSWGDGGPVPFTRDFALTSYFIKSPGADMPSMGWAGTMLSCFAGYRMASETGASNKGVFKVTICTLLIAPVIAIITLLLLTYGYGSNALPMGPQLSGSNMAQYVLRASDYGPGMGDWVPHALLGMAMVGILSILHARFIWFPFEPIGFMIGWSWVGVLMGYWSSFAVAWVAKFITLRVGGSKAYEDLGVPIAVGGVAGCVLGMVIYGALYNIRFFIPF